MSIITARTLHGNNDHWSLCASVNPSSYAFALNATLIFHFHL